MRVLRQRRRQCCTASRLTVGALSDERRALVGPPAPPAASEAADLAVKGRELAARAV